MAVSEFGRELGLAIRALARAPGFTMVVVVTLALGVGANTAVFTVLDAVLLEPLPYSEPDRLVRIYEVWQEDPGELNDYLRTPAVQAYRTWKEAFAGVATLYTYRETGADLTDAEAPLRIVASHVSAGYFETLGVPPLLGRTFREEESLGPGVQNSSRIGAPVAILSHGLWRDRYGSDASVVGRDIRLDGTSYQVVGVMPEGFTDPLGTPPDLWLPADLRLRADVHDDWGNHYLTGIARLAPGLTLEAAQERVDALNARLSETAPDNQGWLVALRPLQETIVGGRRQTLLLVLAGAVGLVLLSACVNVANLVLARGLSRDREVALRGALGSGRGRIVGHLLTETAVLAAAGGAAGLLLGTVGVRGLLALAPDALPAVASPGLSLRVFSFALAGTVGALLVFGLAPAVRLSRAAPADVLRSGGRGGTGSRALHRIRNGLVVAQLAVAVMLLCGASLLLRSFHALRNTDLGLDEAGVLTFEVHLPVARYPDGATRERFHAAFQERIARLPEVEAAGAISWLPVNGRYHSWSMAAREGWDGSLPAEGRAWHPTDARVISGDPFRALGISLLQGADVGGVDLTGPPVVWINRTAATSVFPGETPIGQFVYIGGMPRRVAGVVEDIPFDAQGTVSSTVYIPHAQYADNRNWPLIQVVKARGDPTSVRERVRGELASLDGDLVLYRARTLESILGAARAQERFATLLMTVFAGVALSLAAVGTYGIMAETVTRRRREIGIRLALGAEPVSVRRMVVGAALRLALLGVVFGWVGVWLGIPRLQAFLLEQPAQVPGLYLVGGAGVLLLGVLAAWIPARVATRVQPAETLAGE